MRGQDLDFEEGTFTFLEKGGSWTPLPLPPDMIVELQKRSSNDFVFKVRPETLNAVIKRGSKRLGVKKKLTVHSFRKIFITGLLKEGLPSYVVRRLSRHRSLKIFDEVYTAFTIEDLKEAIASHHPLIKKGFKPEEVFLRLENSLEKSGVKNNPKYRVITNQTDKEVSIKVSYIG